MKARLVLESAAAGGAHTTDLTCQNWALIGAATAPKGYKYKDRELDDGTAKTVVWKSAKAADCPAPAECAP